MSFKNRPKFLRTVEVFRCIPKKKYLFILLIIFPRFFCGRFIFQSSDRSSQRDIDFVTELNINSPISERLRPKKSASRIRVCASIYVHVLRCHINFILNDLFLYYSEYIRLFFETLMISFYRYL